MRLDFRLPPHSSFDLEGLYVRRLQAFWTFGHFEFNCLAIIQRLIAISHNRGEVDENVLSTLALDEAEALAGIEPLHCSLFFTHCIYSFLSVALRLSITKLSYLVLQVPSPSTGYRPSSGQKKWPQV